MAQRGHPYHCFPHGLMYIIIIICLCHLHEYMLYVQLIYITLRLGQLMGMVCKTTCTQATTYALGLLNQIPVFKVHRKVETLVPRAMIDTQSPTNVFCLITYYYNYYLETCNLCYYLYLDQLYILCFIHVGAFSPKVPIQPVLIKHYNRLVSIFINQSSEVYSYES